MTLTLNGFAPLRAGMPVTEPISLSLPSGELLVLLGRNGSGKTTLLTALSGGLPYRGEALADGTPLRSLSPRARARLIAIAPQLPARPHISVRELLLLGRTPYLPLSLRPSDADREAIGRAAELTSVTELLDRTLDTLSGGELARASLGMTLAQQTPILLLDEITAHLDPAYEAELLRLVRRLASEGAAVLAVLHDLTLATRIADRIAVLDGGRLLGPFTPSELIEAGVHESVFGLRRAVTETGESFFTAL